MAATTINIHCKVLHKINDIAARLEMTRKDVIVLLLMRLMRDHERLLGDFHTVRYQEDDIKENWRCFHIRYKPDEYEFFLDLRKVCKCSVSLLVALSVDRYTGELLKERGKKKDVDNYILFKHYFLRRVIVDGIISWQMYWGFPINHLNTLRL